MPARTTATRRTTAPKSNVVDLDEILGEEISTVSLKPIPFKLFGHTFHADGDFNVIRLLGEVEANANLEDQLRSLIVPRDRDRFLKVLGEQPRLTVQATIAIINKITELVAGRPTT